MFPAQRMWPLDGGFYLGTGDAVVTKDPETGRINVGTYRMMIKGPREVGVYTSPGKDATIDREKWWKLGKPMPIAACYGIDPLLFLVAATSLPKTECEYDYYGGINEAPIELFTGDATGLPLPARAEIILEGFLYPDETFAEGPFGEFTGYYGRPSGATPFMRVEKLRYRDRPTLTCALMADGAANEAGLFWAMLRSAGIWADLQKLGVPGIQGVWSIPEAAGWGITVVSIRQMYAGHASQVMALAAQCTAGAYFGKYVIVVDDDVDPTDVHQVLWAMATRSRPAQSIDILRETWSTYLDPSLNPPEIRPWGSKALINACMDYRHYKTFSKRTKLAKTAYDKVVARWQELGLPGKPPAVTIFEDENSTGDVG
jgi:4-hydroxy-3-polyprenylbenzoate decarboxylase